MDAWKGGGGGGARRSKEEQNKNNNMASSRLVDCFLFLFFLVLVYDR